MDKKREYSQLASVQRARKVGIRGVHMSRPLKDSSLKAATVYALPSPVSTAVRCTSLPQTSSHRTRGLRRS
jgi:hypothetical protein